MEFQDDSRVKAVAVIGRACAVEIELENQGGVESV